MGSGLGAWASLRPGRLGCEVQSLGPRVVGLVFKCPNPKPYPEP